jgi:putative transposase
MPRQRRRFFPGLSVHVIRRGINRTAIFGDDVDREMFLLWLRIAMAENGIPVHGLSLMTNHYHAIVTPPSESALPRAMKQLGERYVKHFNRKYDRIGTLWTGRPRYIPIGDEKYFLTCLRYIEMNPVRAQLVRDPADYRWSSSRAHALGDGWEWLVDHVVFTSLGQTAAERQAAYRALCNQPLDEEDLIRQRYAREDRPATLSIQRRSLNVPRLIDGIAK